MTLWLKINKVPALIIHNLHMKFENDWTAVCIVSTKFYIQSAKVEFDLWPCDSKSIEFLLSLSTVYIWSLKVIGIKLCIYYLTGTLAKSERAPPRVCHYDSYFLGDDIDLRTPDAILYSYLPLTMQHLCIKYESCMSKHS